jgi:hypothetical protein
MATYRVQRTVASLVSCPVAVVAMLAICSVAAPAAALAQDTTCVGCVVPVQCQVPSTANACACLIQAFGPVTICREKGFCDEGCGDPLPDAPAPARQERTAIDRSAVDRATVSRTAIKQLFDREPLLAIAVAGSFDYDPNGALFLNLEPYNGGTFEYSGAYYSHQGQFKKLSENRVQFRFVVRELKGNRVETTFVGDLLDQGTAANYTRIRLDARGNLLERAHVTWKTP